MAIFSGILVFLKQIDIFTTASSGNTVDMSTSPIGKFTVVTQSTGAVLSWTVVLEGSIDGSNFSTITTHTNIIGNGVTVFPGANLSPVLYFRARCTELSLGLGTNITVTVLGVQ